MLGKKILLPVHETQDVGSIPDSGRSPGEENCNLFQYSFLEDSMGRGALWATVHADTESDVIEQLSTHIVDL